MKYIAMRRMPYSARVEPNEDKSSSTLNQHTTSKQKFVQKFRSAFEKVEKIHAHRIHGNGIST